MNVSKVVAVLLMTILVPYSFGAFISMEIDPALWAQDLRVVLAIVYIPLGGFVAVGCAAVMDFYATLQDGSDKRSMTESTGPK